MTSLSMMTKEDGEVTARCEDGGLFVLENADNQLWFRWSDAAGVWMYLSDGPPTVVAETVTAEDWADLPPGSRELLNDVRDACGSRS